MRMVSSRERLQLEKSWMGKISLRRWHLRKGWEEWWEWSIRDVWQKSISGGGTSLGKAWDWGACLPFYTNNKKDVTVAGEEWARQTVERNTMRKAMGVRSHLALHVIIWNLSFIWREMRNHGWVLSKGMTRVGFHYNRFALVAFLRVDWVEAWAPVTSLYWLQ